MDQAYLDSTYVVGDVFSKLYDSVTSYPFDDMVKKYDNLNTPVYFIPLTAAYTKFILVCHEVI